MKWKAAEKDFLESARVARVSTVGADGSPHNVPICPVFDRGKIYFGTERNARKVRNLEENPSVAIVFDDYTESWAHLRGIMIRGKARVVGAREFRRIRKKLYQKYLQYRDSATLTDKDSAVVEISPAKKFSWGL